MAQGAAQKSTNANSWRGESEGRWREKTPEAKLEARSDRLRTRMWTRPFDCANRPTHITSHIRDITMTQRTPAIACIGIIGRHVRCKADFDFSFILTNARTIHCTLLCSQQTMRSNLAADSSSRSC